MQRCKKKSNRSNDAMSTDAVAIIGFLALFAMMLLRVPVGMAMGLVGVSGFAYLNGGAPALKLVGQTSMRTVTDYTFGVIPMFLLMGAFVTNSGMSRELFRAANTFVGHLRGGLGIATVAACGGFAAICGSSVATAATFSTVAASRRLAPVRLSPTFATGVIAAGGTLGAMLPPSTVLAVYGIITEQDIGKLFIDKLRLADEGFHAPLDLVDGAARVYDPIVRGELGDDLHGCFLKDYSPSSW